MAEQSAEIAAFPTTDERVALHRLHVVPINATHEGCPLCYDVVATVRGIVRERMAQAWNEGAEGATRIFASNADAILPLFRARAFPPNPYRVNRPGQTGGAA